MSVTKLLLHVCCGPCAIIPALYFLEKGYELTFWFMNPNIQPLREYLRRREAAEQCAQKLNAPIIFADETWDLPAWLSEQTPRVNSPKRCVWCCVSRLKKTRDKARELGFPLFSTTLLYSIYQPHEEIARAGAKLSDEEGPRFKYADFRENFRKGQELAREWELYRQPYCGCVFSEAERYAKKLSRLKQGKNFS